MKKLVTETSAVTRNQTGPQLLLVLHLIGWLEDLDLIPIMKT